MDLSSLKKLSLSIGLYRPARNLSRIFSKARREHYTSDRHFYSQLLPQDNVLCFDVGANVGRISEVLLSLGHRVVAFEPQPDCVREMSALCAPFRGRLTVERMGLSDVMGEAPLFVRQSSGQSSLISAWEAQAIGSIPVPLSTLDWAIEKFGVPYYCKIDVEGWELQVLRGLSQPLSLISFEYHQGEGRMETAYACLHRLRALGPIVVNFTPREESALTLGEWVEPDLFRAAFERASEGNQRFVYGDIYVKTLESPPL